jgi:hypothetical protein
VALDTVGLLPETKDGNMYVLVAIDHYSKWCEARLVKDYDVVPPQNFWKKKSYADLVCPRSFSLIMEVNGSLNLTKCVRNMGSLISSQLHNGFNATKWWKG